ncbi:hypothetical protein O6H91_05G019700 [Diphasiastrum complanatum]|uniref:Uncharacterized protein n=1 Tax=Diphasiastrum complanatum TaxID=34168 RepID=A0ACC2DL57_DIPCM|nr:hypothetical protein O6H91_05G019700 [Diphasiastrum complanatum]
MTAPTANRKSTEGVKYQGNDADHPVSTFRIIACFQPLHECQARYFRQLLKPIT